MKKSIADKWVKALRSGKYEQGIGALKMHDRYCCLGVLCDISKKGKWLPYGGIADGSPENYWIGGIGEFYQLPMEVIIWAGMKSRIGTFWRDESTISSLSQINDDSKWSFKKIAVFIAKNYKEL